MNGRECEIFDDALIQGPPGPCFVCGKETEWRAEVCDEPVCKEGCLARSWDSLRGPKVTFSSPGKEEVFFGPLTVDNNGVFINGERVGYQSKWGYYVFRVQDYFDKLEAA